MTPLAGLRLVGFLLFSTASGSAVADAPPGQGGGGATPATPTDGIPSSPEQRTYYPTTDYFDPEDLIGSFLYIVKDTHEMAMAQESSVPKSAIVTTKFQNATPAMTFDFSKKDDVNVAVPGILSADYEHSDVVHLELSDIAETRIKGPGASFCKEWPNFRHVRQGLWRAGDRILYVRHVLTSRADYQTGTKEKEDAKVGIGRYFSFGGDEAKATGTEKHVPAMAVNGVVVTLSDDLIRNGCRIGGGHGFAAGFASNYLTEGIGHVITKAALKYVIPAKPTEN